MDEVIVEVHPQLAEVASTKSLDATLDIEGYAVGGMELKTPQGVTYHAELTNTGEGIVLAGTVVCAAISQCARCLKPVEIDVEGELEGYFLLQAAEEIEGYERDEFDCVTQEGTFDIAPAIQAALVYATPYVVLCKDDCAGLCPSCGADLNEGPCACDQRDDIDPDNPFAVLKNIKFDE